MSTVVGVVSGVIALFNFAQNLFPSPDPSNCNIRIQLGLNGGGGLDEAGGDIPDIRLFNESSTLIGEAHNLGYINNGGFRDLSIGQTPGQQPTYALFTGNNDAVCIAYITQTWPDSQTYGWIGNWGRLCGEPWYYSSIYWSGPTTLECTWLDGNRDQTDVTAFQIHFPEFNDKGQGFNSDVNSYCNSMFQYTDDPSAIHTKRDTVNYRQSRAYPPPKQRKRTNLPLTQNHLVKSAIPGQSATEICASGSSYGPSFVSIPEGVFCDMKTKTTQKLCNGSQDETCFDLSTLAEKVGGIVTQVLKFDKIIEWNGVDAESLAPEFVDPGPQ